MAHRAFVVLLLLGAAARAETNFGARGQVVPFGGVSYTHGSAGGNSADQLTLAPGVFWFPTNSLAIGGSVQYAYGSGAGFTAHNLGFEPLVGFGVPLGDRTTWDNADAAGIAERAIRLGVRRLLVLDLVLVACAVIFLLLVIIRRGRIVTNLGVALLLIVLAAALWYTSIRNAPPLP